MIDATVVYVFATAIVLVVLGTFGWLIWFALVGQPRAEAKREAQAQADADAAMLARLTRMTDIMLAGGDENWRKAGLKVEAMTYREAMIRGQF